MKRIALFAALGPLLAAACAAPLATLPPSDAYAVVDEPGPVLTGDERQLYEDINKELARLGLPPASLGTFEINAAAVLDNVALARVWNGSGRDFGVSQDVAAKENTTVDVTGTHRSGSGRLGSLTDEEDDTSLKHMHTGQHLISRGIPNNMNTYVFDVTNAETRVHDDELKKGVRIIRPHELKGKFTLGVAALAAGDADKRLFAIASRDRIVDVVKGPPRTAMPGSTFDFSGIVVAPEINHVAWGLAAPDGKVTLGRAAVDRDGKFAVTVTLPSAPGLYVFSVRDGINVPIFAGVPPTPWPVSADPKATPVDGTRSIAQRLVKAIADWRRGHGLAVPTFDANLSALAKTEASLYAKAADEESGPNSGTPEATVTSGFKARMATAGVDTEQLTRFWGVDADDFINDFFARLPANAFQTAALGSATLESVGIGVALAPNTVTQDDDLTRYAIVWMVKDPTPPKAVELESNQPSPATAPAQASPAPSGDVKPAPAESAPRQAPTAPAVLPAGDAKPASPEAPAAAPATQPPAPAATTP